MRDGNFKQEVIRMVYVVGENGVEVRKEDLDSYLEGLRRRGDTGVDVIAVLSCGMRVEFYYPLA